MFIQVIQGKVSDSTAARAALDRWMKDLAPGAKGWLGSTAGVTQDGRFIALARFESKDAAQRNSKRPEQDQWWSETAKLFDGEPMFLDSDEVLLDLAGNPDDATFVQIIQGKGSDSERAKQLMTENSDEWAAFRPDVIGSAVVQHGGGRYSMAMYFTSEAAAREGETKEPPAKLKAQMDELNAMSEGMPEFHDLKEPWLYSAR